MTLQRLCRTIIKTLAGAVLVLVIGSAAFVAIRQRILRWRAEQLLADVRAIQMGKSTWTDAQEFMNRWNKWSYSADPCIESKCTFGVELQDDLSTLYSAYDRATGIWNMLAFPYLVFGGRPTLVTAHLEIRDGDISESEFTLFLTVPPSRSNQGNGYGLVGKARHIEGRFDPYEFRDQRLIHPEYWIGKPGGCEGCIKLVSSTTPMAGKKKILELTDFNLSCTTRWFSCTTEADILPSAWKQYQQEFSDNQTRKEAFEACKVPMEFWGREYENIAIADMISVPSHPVPTLGHDEYVDVRFQLISKLKGQIDWPLNRIYEVMAFDRGEAIREWRSTDLVAGRRYILLGSFSVFKDNPVQKVLALDDCGVVPYSQQNLSDIQRGINESFARRAPD